MTLVRYDPWNSLSKLHDEVNRLFNDSLQATDGDQSHVVTSNWSPAVDVVEESDRYLITADVPGVDPKDIELTVESGVLTLRGERKLEQEHNEGGYRRIERYDGTFYRRFALPDNADTESVSAKGNHGVLEVSIPKTERAQARRISVEH